MFGLIMPFEELAPVTLFLIGVLIIWSLIWKGYGLWVSASRKDRWWFVAMFLVNSAGILEIIYLFFISKHLPRHDNQSSLENT